MIIRVSCLCPHTFLLIHWYKEPKVARNNNIKFSEILNVSLMENIPPLGTRTLYNHMN